MDWAVRLYKGVARGRRPDGVFRLVILLGVDDQSFVGAPPTILMGDLADHITRFSLAALGRGPAVGAPDAPRPAAGARGRVRA
jgi:hypothetical protein